MKSKINRDSKMFDMHYRDDNVCKVETIPLSIAISREMKRNLDLYTERQVAKGVSHPGDDREQVIEQYRCFLEKLMSENEKLEKEIASINHSNKYKHSRIEDVNNIPIEDWYDEFMKESKRSDIEEEYSKKNKVKVWSTWIDAYKIIDRKNGKVMLKIYFTKNSSIKKAKNIVVDSKEFDEFKRSPSLYLATKSGVLKEVVEENLK